MSLRDYYRLQWLTLTRQGTSTLSLPSRTIENQPSVAKMLSALLALLGCARDSKLHLLQTGLDMCSTLRVEAHIPYGVHVRRESAIKMTITSTPPPPLHPSLPFRRAGCAWIAKTRLIVHNLEAYLAYRLGDQLEGPFLGNHSFWNCGYRGCIVVFLIVSAFEIRSWLARALSSAEQKKKYTIYYTTSPSLAYCRRLFCSCQCVSSSSLLSVIPFLVPYLLYIVLISNLFHLIRRLIGLWKNNHVLIHARYNNGIKHSFQNLISTRVASIRRVQNCT